jgi:DMSO/TMAO reductase YedYZ molybdopterin-dependent catalytic subunit
LALRRPVGYSHRAASKGAKWIRKIEFPAADQRGVWEVRGYSNSTEPWFKDRYGLLIRDTSVSRQSQT